MKRLISFALMLCLLLPVSLTAAADTPSDWAQAEVETAISLGLVPAHLQGAYQTPITRAEFTELIAALAGAWYPSQTLKEMSLQRQGDWDGAVFSDTDAESVRFCASLGIVSGDGKGQFMPDDHLTRQQAAKILFATADTMTEVVMESRKPSGIHRVPSWLMPHTFEDSAQLRVWSRNAVTWCYRTGVMTGEGAAFAPDGSYTREQSILTILRLYYLYGQAYKLTPGAVDYYPLVSEAGQAVERWLSSEWELVSASERGALADPDAAYGFVYDSVGVGVTYGHVIDRSGEMQFTDLYGTGGYFKNAVLCGDWITLYLAKDRPHDKTAPDMVAINTVTGERREHEEILPESQPGAVEIRAESTGYYALYGANDEKLSDTYQNALRSCGENLYLGWVSDTAYDVLSCDGSGAARKLRTQTFALSTEVHDLGGGLYAAQSGTQQIEIFDWFGDTVATITLETPCTLTYGANGILVVQAEGNVYRYTATGASLPIWEE